MISYGKIRSGSRPKEVDMTASQVFIATNIEPYTIEIDGVEESGYQYDYVGYTKDEYLLEQTNKITQLEQELQAAKILLGVD